MNLIKKAHMISFKFRIINNIDGDIVAGILFSYYRRKVLTKFTVDYQ